MIAFLLAPVYILINIYIYRRTIGWMAVGINGLRQGIGRAVSIAVYVFFAVSSLLAFVMPQSEARRILKEIGNYWLGVLLYMIFVIVIADAVRLFLLHVVHIDREKLCAPRVHRLVGRVCAAAIILVSVFGVINAGIVRVTPYEVTVEKELAAAAETADADTAGVRDLKIVLVSDLHLGYNIGLRQMEKMVERINTENADLVVMAGDIFDNEWEAVQEPARMAALLRSIRSKYGVYACYGNHDIEEPILAGFTFRQSEAKASSPEMNAFLEEAGIRLLRDEGVLIDGSFYLYGRADARRPGTGITVRKTPREITADMDKSKPIIVLDHQPRELEELAAAGVDLDLCGHTHDGQIFPGNLVIRPFWENFYGYLQKGSMHNIVTSGVGLFGPNMRVGTKAEICPITVHFDGTEEGGQGTQP